MGGADAHNGGLLLWGDHALKTTSPHYFHSRRRSSSSRNSLRLEHAHNQSQSASQLYVNISPPSTSSISSCGLGGSFRERIDSMRSVHSTPESRWTSIEDLEVGGVGLVPQHVNVSGSPTVNNNNYYFQKSHSSKSLFSGLSHRRSFSGAHNHLHPMYSTSGGTTTNYPQSHQNHHAKVDKRSRSCTLVTAAVRIGTGS